MFGALRVKDTNVTTKINVSIFQFCADMLIAISFYMSLVVGNLSVFFVQAGTHQVEGTELS